ncbi:MAG: hypothetical protein EON55_12155, partial [Alphaproteobacteria bacterium]
MRRLFSEKGLPAGALLACSASGGTHYLFNYRRSIAAGLKEDVPGRSKLVVDGVRASVDSRINNNCLVVAPTGYAVPGEAEARRYRWLTEVPPAADLPPAPRWLIENLNHNTPQKPRHSPPAVVQDDNFLACRPLLHEAGFRNCRRTRWKADGFDFVADRACQCPCCLLHHDSNEWYSIQLCEGLFEVRSYSSRCRSKLLGLSKHRMLQNLLFTPATDEVYVDIFANHFRVGKHGSPIIWTGARWLQFGPHL